jgi:hypothetical protein
VTDSEERSTRDRLRKQSADLFGKIPLSEIRRQLITSLGVAFGALIGFMWQSVVQQLFTVAGVITSSGIHDFGSWVLYAFGAIVVTFISVIMLLLLARGQVKAEEKKA